MTIIPTNVQFADANRNIISASGVALAGFGPGDPALEPDRLGSYGLPGLSFVRDSAVPTNVTDHEIGHNFIDGNHTPSNISCLMNASSGYPDFSAGKAAEISTTCAELGPSGLGYTADDCESNIILPIRLVSFDARYNDNTTSVQLDWTVASQVNTDRMHIERSIDGGITWEMIPDCDIAGAGSTSERMTYSCEDLSPVPGRINYYRLIDIDFDNTKNIGPIQAVHVPVSTDGTFYTGANPVSAGSMIDVHPEVPVQIIDMLGRVVSTSNNGVLQTPDQAGMYIMTDGSTTQKLIVQ